MAHDAETKGIINRIKKQRGVDDDEAIEAGVASGELERDEEGNVRKKRSMRGVMNQNERKLMEEQGLD